MNIPEFSVINKTLIGFSVNSEKELLSKLLANDFSNLYGDFIFIVEGLSGNREVIIMLTSAVNANPYYYTIEDGKLLHGKDIFYVFQSMKTSQWNWNHTSLYCLANLDYCIDDQSLNADIIKVPAGSVFLYFKGDEQGASFPVAGRYEFNKNTFGTAFKEYENLAKDYFRENDKYVLSLSAGMDSRLLLASLLSNGIKPVTFTMGQPEATDVKISNLIARDFGLQHSIVSLSAADYLNDTTAREIIKATSGTKLFAHWHTYIYINKLGVSNDHIHLVGSNGEISRSYYFDKGFFSKILQQADMGMFRKIFNLKLQKVDPQVIGSIKEKINRTDILNLIESSCTVCNNTADKLDWFYTFERVRNFIANGMAIYNQAVPTLSPFLDERFVRLAFLLKRKYKLNSLFHKMAIEALCPALMQYGVSENSKDIKSISTNFYWLKQQHSISYNLRNEALENDLAKELILESNELSAWIDRTAREKLYTDKNYRTLSFLFTFHHILKIIEDARESKLKQK